MPFFEKQIKEETNFELPKQDFIDYAELHKKRRQQSFNLLFDKESLQKEVNNIFDQFEKDELEANDLWDYRRNDKGLSEGSFPISAFDLVREFTYGDKTTNRDVVNKWFNKQRRVENYQIENIYEDIKNKPELEVTSNQIKFIENWCVSVANYSAILSAIKATEDYKSFSINRNINMLWFFIKQFKLKFPSDIMLAFTLFEDFERRNLDNESSEIDELEEFVEKREIEDKVVNNLQIDITTDRIWKNNALYAIRNNLTAAYPFIIRDLKDYRKSEYYRPDVLRLFYSKTKDFKTLQDILAEIELDALSWTIVEQLIDSEQHSKDFLVQYLLNRMKQESDTLENRLLAARYLIELDNIEGLRFYADYFIKKNDPSMEYHYIDRLFAKLKDATAIPILLELLKLSKQPEFQIEKFNRLDALVLDAFYNIGMTNEANLEKVKDALISFIEDHKNIKMFTRI